MPEDLPDRMPDRMPPAGGGFLFGTFSLWEPFDKGFSNLWGSALGRLVADSMGLCLKRFHFQD